MRQPEQTPPMGNEGRTAIVEAAAQCFMRRGYERTTIDDIARALNATKGLIYHRFRSKGALFFEVYRQAMQFCFDAVDPITTSDLPANEKLLKMARAHALVMMDKLHYQRGIKLGLEIYFTGATTLEERETLQDLIALRDRYESRFRTVLQAGVVEGTLIVPDIAIAGRAILAALNGLTDWYRPRDTEAEEDRLRIADAVASMLVQGVIARPDSAR